jgi:hypothetical protein
MRRTGHGWPDGRETTPVRARTIQGEIKQLRQMIYWAMNERLPDGSWLLENNPLRGVKLPKEEDPRRPVATFDRFLKLREAAGHGGYGAAAARARPLEALGNGARAGGSDRGANRGDQRSPLVGHQLRPA